MSDVEYGQKPRMGQNLGWSRDVEFGPKPRMGQNLGWVPGMWNLVKNGPMAISRPSEVSNHDFDDVEYLPIRGQTIRGPSYPSRDMVILSTALLL